MRTKINHTYVDATGKAMTIHGPYRQSQKVMTEKGTNRYKYGDTWFMEVTFPVRDADEPVTLTFKSKDKEKLAEYTNNVVIPTILD